MTEFKGTPGPWLVDGSVIRGDADHIGRTVAVASTLNVAWPYGRRAIKEQPYNARLIAAAPDLLKALQAITQQTNSTELSEALDLSRAAIAKALGETT